MRCDFCLTLCLVGCLAYVVFRNHCCYSLWLYSSYSSFSVHCYIDFRSSVAVLPLYTPAINADCLARGEIIEECLNLGMNYVEILSFLVNVHGIHIGLRQIRRILKKLGCRRRGVRSNFNEIVRVMENEYKESGSMIGYRAMHQRLTVQHSFNLSRNIVRQALKKIRTERSKCTIKTPTATKSVHCKKSELLYLWHINGHGKLKPFGFCVHGAI